MNFPRDYAILCTNEALAIRDYLITNQKSWVSPKNQVAAVRRENYLGSGGETFVLHFYLSVIRKLGLRPGRI